MDGLLLIDKPSGLTSHDVVARIRRSTRERTVGHTGTLDPRATGLLPLVLGRATRLASRLTAGDKSYDATVRLGFATETDDEEGAPLGDRSAVLPDELAIVSALDHFRGTLEQVPPRHSAKKIGGTRAYALARRDQPAMLKPVTVTVRHLEWLGRAGDLVFLRLVVSAGFYVRALARDLGADLGCGAHLAALRRTRTGSFDVANAIPLAAAEALGPDIASRLIAPADALPHLMAVSVNEAGLKRIRHGNAVGPEHLASPWAAELARTESIRILAGDGQLVALAQARGGALHPVVVLG